MRSLLKIMPVIFALLSCAGEPEKRVKYSDDQNNQSFIRIQGANALYPLAQIWADRYMSDHPGIKITVFPASSSKGKTDLIRGLADIGMYSSPVTDENSDSVLLIKVAKDAVLPIINSRNPDFQILVSRGISPTNLKDIFIKGQITHWNQITGLEIGEKIDVYSRSDKSGASAVWADFLGTTQENLLGTGVYGDAGMTQAIKASINSLGYDNLRYIFDNNTGKPYPGLASIPIDFNNNHQADPDETACLDLESMIKSISSGFFPSPPARDLYFIIHHKSCPKHVLDFLEWVLSVGITEIENAGFIKLSDKEIAAEKQKLKIF